MRVTDSISQGLRFLKMHGLGNDFVVLDSRPNGERTTPSLARGLGDRHRGVGFDQLAEILPAPDGIALNFWNADGTRAEACGNATRCVAALVLDETGAQALSIQTARGALSARRSDDGMVSVNMGMPQIRWQDIPLALACDSLHLPLDGDPVGVGMGNPHCVFMVEDAEAVDVATWGARVEHDPLFPKATNVEFVSQLGPDHLRMRVWERGTGITLACGSGACAAAVAAHRRGLTGKCVSIELDGGTLVLDWRDDGVWMTGPTAQVFEGTLSPDFLAALDHG